jgi:hypothetical protein
MSEYRNFISDFPSRCSELLQRYEKDARNRQREVTLMLCVAAPAIIVPMERLNGPGFRQDGTARAGHPSKDWQRFQAAKAALDDLYAASFIGSLLCPDAAPGSWCFGQLSDTSGDPDSWPELNQPKPLGPDKKAKSVLLHIRNSLAHGNLFTRGGEQIQQMVLLSKPPDAERFSYLIASPADFRAFLIHWLEFLNDLELPLGVIAGSEAA